MQTFCHLFQFRCCFFLQRDHRHFNPLAARALQHQERKPPVSGDQPPSRFAYGIVRHEIRLSYFTIPRSAFTANAINSRTSSESANFARISASACEVFFLERTSNLNACCSFFKRSAENPLRSSPMVFAPKHLVSRSVTISEKGITSWVMTVHAPIYAY